MVGVWLLSNGHFSIDERVIGAQLSTWRRAVLRASPDNASDANAVLVLVYEYIISYWYDRCFDHSACACGRPQSSCTCAGVRTVVLVRTAVHSQPTRLLQDVASAFLPPPLTLYRTGREKSPLRRRKREPRRTGEGSRVATRSSMGRDAGNDSDRLGGTLTVTFPLPAGGGGRSFVAFVLATLSGADLCPLGGFCVGFADSVVSSNLGNFRGDLGMCGSAVILHPGSSAVTVGCWLLIKIVSFPLFLEACFIWGKSCDHPSWK